MLHPDPLYLVEADVVAAPVIEAEPVNRNETRA